MFFGLGRSCTSNGPKNFEFRISNEELRIAELLHSQFEIRNSSFIRRSRLAPADRLLHHVLVDGDRAASGRRGIELEIANHAPVCLAQSAGAEAFLARGVPGDGDERAARDLQVDAEALKVRARCAKDRLLGLDKNL